MERRNFFKLASVSAASLAVGSTLVGSTLVGCNSPVSNLFKSSDSSNEGLSAGVPINFTEEADVLIIGSGIAGLSAAMDPSEAGLSVMVADKLDVLGGESYNANGLMYVSGTDIQENAGITTSVDDAWKDLQSRLESDGITADMDFQKKLFEGRTAWVNRVATDYHAQFEDPKTYVSKGSPSTFLLPKNGLGDMTSVMTPIKDQLMSQGVNYHLGLRAIDFILDGNATPVGMRFYTPKTNTITDVKAKKIVLASGGFTCNQEMIHTYQPKQAAIGCYTTYAAGEGQGLCLTLGGQLSNMDTPVSLTSDLPQVDAWGLFGPVIDLTPQGQRFAAEDKTGAAADACNSKELGYWWTVFDKQLSNNNQSRSVSYITNKSTNRVVGPFDTLEDLAAAMSISPDALKSSFDKYNAAVSAKKDSDFNRTLFLQSLSAPYYAVKAFPKRFRTIGGAATTADGQLKDAGGTPIENVYYCGACAAGSFTGLTSHAAFGVIVGQAIVQSLQDAEGNQEQSADASSGSQDAGSDGESDQSIENGGPSDPNTEDQDSGAPSEEQQ